MGESAYFAFENEAETEITPPQILHTELGRQAQEVKDASLAGHLATEEVFFHLGDTTPTIG